MCILSEGVSRRTVEAPWTAAHLVHQYMRQTQFSLAAEPTQQRILALAMAMKPFGRNALNSGTEWFSRRGGTRRLHATYMKHQSGIYMGKVGETVKHPATWVKIAKANCKPPAVPVALRIAAAISAYPSARSDRKRGLAKLRLDDGLLRRCGIRPGRQLQHCRALAIAQARD